jgi:RNA polymerase subunit RPABC4/transcription elongation factor Spt4
VGTAANACSRCGKPMTPDLLFCPSCGMKA